MAEPDQANDFQVSRRNLFQILGAVPVAAATATAAVAYDQHTPAAHSTASKASFKRQVFDDHQWKTVHVLCDLVIPADKRSGSATQAGVPEFIDDWLAFRTQQDGHERLQAEILGGLMWLDRESNRLCEKDFAEASVDKQRQILDRVAWPSRTAKEDQLWEAFFNQFRDLTVVGFFSSKIGVADLPYLGNTVVPEWKGCDPKVWAIIEDRMKNGYEGLVKPADQRS